VGIQRVYGNLLKSDAQTLVNTVNCVGVMGKGIAEKFKKAYPDMFEDYVRRCDEREVTPGVPYVFVVRPGRQILNFPTKKHWRGESRLDWVSRGLDEIESRWADWNIQSLAVPPLGCGHGGLAWNDVEPLIVEKLSSLPIRVELYVPEASQADDYQPELEFG
jgi:O-acetyl-ADP-ribose deacetylase (regulator of RNase III)